MSSDQTHPIQSIAEWLKENAINIFQSLNPGSPNIPQSWPEKLRGYYRLYNGQKGDSDFLFPKFGNWLSVEDALMAHKIWLEQAEEYNFKWYKKSYVPIAAYLEQMEDATVIDIETGQIGNVDIEAHEFSFLFENVDGLFLSLLDTLRAEGYPPEKELKIHTDEEWDQFERQRALALEQEHCQIDDDPSSEQLFSWGMHVFRKEGDPSYSKPNPHFMRLAKKYFEQIPSSHLSKKQARDIAFFNHRYQQIVKNA